MMIYSKQSAFAFNRNQKEPKSESHIQAGRMKGNEKKSKTK